LFGNILIKHKIPWGISKKNAHICGVFCFPKCHASFFLIPYGHPLGIMGKKKSHQILHSIMALE
jgi:hypothetical protein